MAASNVFGVRETYGTYCLNGPPKFEQWEKFKKEEGESRFMVTTFTSKHIAIGNNSCVNIYEKKDGQLIGSLRHKLIEGSLSPNGSYLIGWDNPNQNYDNFTIWEIKEGKNIKSVYSLKLSKPPEVQFSGDEKKFARLSSNIVMFSHLPDFSVIANKTPETMKVGNFSLSTGTAPLHVLLYIPSNNAGTPSFARLYRYPNFDTIVASKSFFQADTVKMKWNYKGTAVLLITTTEIDKTGKSYYGKTMLHYLDTKGETAMIQTESDSNVIHAAEWSPNSMEFAAITGKMPQTRAVIFNSRCEVIFDMNIAARNAIYFNPQGNLLLLCGFGNLSHGNVEIWEIKKHKKLLATMSAPLTTQLAWLNDGVHFITASTAPRRQIDNEFRIYDYTSKVCFEWKAEKHLYGICPFLSSPSVPFADQERLDKFVAQLGKKPQNLQETKTGVAGGKYVVRAKRGEADKGALLPKTHGKPAAQVASSEDVEKEKKIKNLKKKLDQIKKLKSDIEAGKAVEKNQLEKISKEKELLSELSSLEIS